MRNHRQFGGQSNNEKFSVAQQNSPVNFIHSGFANTQNLLYFTPKLFSLLH